MGRQQHANYFNFLEKYVVICENALKLISHIFWSNCTPHYDVVLWRYSVLCFRTWNIWFVLITSERYFKISKIGYQFGLTTIIIYVI